ncbi:MAG: cytochrome c oxidase accessory protein CcoG [Pseudogulbenkiania sp.]|nr:cytochrome c oxidase accessory protein CcoG [Pseudogulbenkiania sp.]
MSTVPAIPIKLYPRLTRGRFNNWRVVFVVVTQLLYFGLPWLQWHERQAVWFDLVGGRFHLFGLTLLPQDMVYLAALLMASAFGLFLWTTLAGRLWCGFSCPQTVYTEIMLWIERWTEGKPAARRALDAAPWSLNKLSRKGGKHALMVAFSLWTGLTLVGYFSPLRELATGLPTLAIGPWEAFWALFYGGFTYLLAGVLREKVCLHMCPYARFQGAMFDPDTKLVAYDAPRGEPRGALRKDAAPGMARGDCVDCGLCVQVCPTGIDIRAGLQYECIGCAACIDACDAVMDKIGAPRGLIRFTTQRAEDGGDQRPRRLWQRPRVLIYGGLLAILLALTLTGLLNHTPYKLDVLRDRASLVREGDDGWLENSYSLRVMNGDERPHRFLLTVEGLPGVQLRDAVPVQVPALTVATVGVRVAADPATVQRGSQPLRFVLHAEDDPQRTVTADSSFIGE